MKTLAFKRPNKEERETQVLLGLVDLYLQMGKPIGSNTLRENGFENISSATIRNYFAKLENQGYLHQQHSSGGRVPTDKAYHLYASKYLEEDINLEKEKAILEKILGQETKKVTEYLHLAAEALSELTNCSVFFNTPIFDVDLIKTIQLIPFEDQKLLCILMTNFGMIRTEILYIPKDFTKKELAFIQQYCFWRINKQDKPEISDGFLWKWAQRIYNEIIVRHVVESSSYLSENLFKTGLSKLLTYTEFSEANQLANGFALLENPEEMHQILKKCMEKNELSFWIGDKLEMISSKAGECTVIAIPYYINKRIIGSFALLGPKRIPYRQLFSLMRFFSEKITETLTKSAYKFQISFKESNQDNLSDYNSSILLEDKSH